MIIPIRCFSCNSVIAGKWNKYIELVDKYRKSMGLEHSKIQYLSDKKEQVTPEAKAMDDLGLDKKRHWCCRRHFLTHIDIL
jgi:DNA-directed RNA polymerase subunit N (RpoN/RPB10)